MRANVPKMPLWAVLTILSTLLMAFFWHSIAPTGQADLPLLVPEESRVDPFSSSDDIDQLLTFTLRKKTAKNDEMESLKENIRPFFLIWMGKHKQNYEDPDELEFRLETFATNAKTVALHNDAFSKGWTLYRQTIMNSPFSDMTAEEFSATHLMEAQNCSATHLATGTLREDFELPEELPPFIDWRTRGILTPVKSQQHCGSCWTFATSGALEAHTCLHSGDALGLDCPTWNGLAEQQLLDCAWNYDNHGCNGGLPSHAFEYLKHADGMHDEDSYPYRVEDSHACKEASIDSKVVAPVSAVYNVTSRMEDDLVSAIAHIGPVAVAYQVASDFRFYRNGVYDSFNATSNTTICKDDNMSVNHAVVAVGFGTTDDGVPYYIVRNSWSATFGMEGHFWILRGKNLCGISDCASFPIVPSTNKNVGRAVSEPQQYEQSFLRKNLARGGHEAVEVK